MGLFSFLKNAGASLFKGKDAPAEPAADASPDVMKVLQEQRAQLLKNSVLSLGLDVENLDVTIDGDVVTIYGQVPTHEAREKVILAVGNVEGVATVDDRLAVVEPPKPESQFHTVERGDTLSKIAKVYYGNAMKYPVIFEANKPMLSDPDKIYPGQVLRIPNLDA